MTEHLNLNTTELQAGDLVHTHGMRVRLQPDPVIIDDREFGGSLVYAWRGTVENLTEVLAEGFVPPSFLQTERWDEDLHRWVIDKRDQWTIQGNHLARWAVERGN